MPSTSEKNQETTVQPRSPSSAELKWLVVLAALVIATILDGVSIAASSMP